MDFITAYILTDTPGQYHIQVSPHVVNGLNLIHVQADYSALAPIQLYKPFLAKHRICLINCMHVDADIISHLTDRGQSVPLPYHVRGNPHDNLVAQLYIDCFITVEINLQEHKTTIFRFV